MIRAVVRDRDGARVTQTPVTPSRPRQGSAPRDARSLPVETRLLRDYDPRAHRVFVAEPLQ